MKFDWNRTRAFLATAEEGSLSAAARALGMTQPTLGRQVEALEDELNVILFERTGRGLSLTPAGLDLLEHARAMGEAASRVSLGASGKAQTIEGEIAIAVSEAYAAFLLPPIVARLRKLHPGIDIEMVVSNNVANLKAREADIAVRSFRPTENDLVARKIREDAGRFYATPAYLRSIGNPKTPAELSKAEFIGFDRSDVYRKGLAKMGIVLEKANFSVLSDNHLVQWQLVKQGVGIGVMPEAIGEEEPAVTRVLADFPAIPVPMWLTAHREVNTSRRVRVVFDFLAQELADAWPEFRR